MSKKKVKNSDTDTEVLKRVIGNNAITIEKAVKKQKGSKEHSQQPSNSKGSFIMNVSDVKEEVIDVDEYSNPEMSEYSDYDNAGYVDDKPANEIFFAETINFEAAYTDETVDEDNDLAQLYDEIDFTCTKCRKTSKNPDYFLKKTDVQCSDCQSTMKLQCPYCKLLFRKFDSAIRHAKLSCPVGEYSSLTTQTTGGTDVRKCLICEFSTHGFMEFRQHMRRNHPNAEATNACKLCSRVYKSRDSMLKHMRFCGQKPHIVCEFCGYKTKRIHHLRTHMRHKHPDPESCHGGGYECPICKKKYKYLLPMKSHTKTCGLRKAEPNISVEGIEMGENEEVVREENEQM